MGQIPHHVSWRTLDENGRLPVGWFRNLTPDEINLASPGIYEWRLAGIGIYIGKSKRLAARRREYPNNLRKLLKGEPYRIHRETGFRLVHHKLKFAFESGAEIAFSVLENCAADVLNQRERYWIERRRRDVEGSGLEVLNGCWSRSSA